MPQLDPKEKIKSMINNIINDNIDGAKEDFHAALQQKMQDHINPPAVEDETVEQDDDSVIGSEDDENE